MYAGCFGDFKGCKRQKRGYIGAFRDTLFEKELGRQRELFGMELKYTGKQRPITNLNDMKQREEEEALDSSQSDEEEDPK